MDLKEFFEKYCKNCKEICDKGLIERKDFFRCVDRDIFVKKTEENKK